MSAKAEKQEVTSKAIIRFGYAAYVVDVGTAVELFTKLKNVEILENEWDADTRAQTYRIKPVTPDHVTLSHITEETYATAKLLAKAEETNKTQGDTK